MGGACLTNILNSIKKTNQYFDILMFQCFNIYDCYVGRTSSQWNNSTGICAQIRYFNSPVIIQNHTVHNCTLSHSTGILSKLSVKSSLTYQYVEEEEKIKVSPKLHSVDSDLEKSVDNFQKFLISQGQLFPYSNMFNILFNMLSLP